MGKLSRGVLAAGVALAPFMANAASVISNGNFSAISGTLATNGVCSLSPNSGQIGEGITTCAATGWTGNAYQIANGPGNVTGNSFNVSTPVPGGGNALVLQSAESASQTVSVATAGVYDLTFDVANRSNAPYNGPQTVAVSLDGSVVANGDLSSLSTAWTGETFALNLAAGNHTLMFAGLDPSGGDVSAFISDVSLATPAPVPLPAAAWLLLSGLGGLGAWARRRKSA